MKIKLNYIYLITVIFVETMLIQGGCTPRSSIPPENSQVILVHSLTPTFTVTKPVETVTEFPVVLTLTPSPNLTASSTPKPTPTRTWTAVPTLMLDKSQAKILEYYENNGNCQLPCLWGITPGQTTWAEARSILSPLAHEWGPVSRGTLMRFDYSFLVPDEIAIAPDFPYFEFGLQIKDNIVTIIYLSSGFTYQNFEYSLSGILNNFGKPGEIWIELITDSMYDPHYELDLFYPQKGMLFNATGFGQITDNTFEFCPHEFRRGNFPPGLTLFPSSEGYSFNYIRESFAGEELDEFHLMREISVDFDEEQFFNTYSDPTNDSCIQIDLEKIP